jgi:alkylhydroperoxidase family enzyme
MLAHGAVLRKNFFTAEQLMAIVKDFHNASLPLEEVAIMAFTQKVITHAHQINEKDHAVLRAFGLSDEEILDIIITASARSFFSKTLDAIGAEPDEVYLELEPELRQHLTLGRSFPKDSPST